MWDPRRSHLRVRLSLSEALCAPTSSAICIRAVLQRESAVLFMVVMVMVMIVIILLLVMLVMVLMIAVMVLMVMHKQSALRRESAVLLMVLPLNGDGDDVVDVVDVDGDAKVICIRA